MEILRLVVFLAATVTTGMMAGIFFAYSNSIMPGLRRVDDDTFVRTFAALDRAILNPLFLVGGFLGAPVLTGLAIVLHVVDDARSPVPWMAAALVLYLVTFVITVAVNVPRNDALKAADPATAGVAAIRAAFDERRWARWNLARTVLTTAAFALLAYGLVRTGGLA
ncbi:DUF1772 domain-containing protein [Luedemannella helvata]|uniref:anthrone oxygenase family protein n=1 Tax=Luedemannella helvata TaxID=349315 RepID=UPI0031D90E52